MQGERADDLREIEEREGQSPRAQGGAGVARDVGEQSREAAEVNGDQADFYFRKGRTPEDTQSNLWYIVRWKDRPGHSSAVSREPAGVDGTTWGRIKLLFRPTGPAA